MFHNVVRGSETIEQEHQVFENYNERNSSCLNKRKYYFNRASSICNIDEYSCRNV